MILHEVIKSSVIIITKPFSVLRWVVEFGNKNPVTKRCHIANVNHAPFTLIQTITTYRICVFTFTGLYITENHTA